MKEITRMQGQPGIYYGIWNSYAKAFQFGICEPSPMLAEARLCYKIGMDSKKWRFQVKEIPKTNKLHPKYTPDKT